jgi:M6 family metalloprotease-like protein
MDDELLFNASSSSLTNSESVITGLQILEEPIFAKVEGDQRVLVLLFNFKNTPAPTITVDKLRDVVFDRVADYFQEVSYGRVSISGNVFGPYQLSSPNPCSMPYADHQAAATAADRDVDFREYDIAILVAPYNNCIPGGDAIIGGGAQILTTGEGKVSMKLARINSNADATDFFLPNSNIRSNYMANVISHELGHVFGMYHADSADCGNQALTAQFTSKDSGCTLNDYGDPYDIMGSNGHFNAPHKEFLEWFAPSNIETVEGLAIGENRLYHLEPLETATNGLKVLKIPRGGDDFLYVEFRQPIGYDTSFMGLDYRTPIKDPNGAESDVYNGATLHLPNSKGPQNAHTYIIDPTPDGSSNRPSGTHPFFLSVLPIGASFTDPLTGITVTVDSVTGSGPTSLLNVVISKIPDLIPVESKQLYCDISSDRTILFVTVKNQGGTQAGPFYTRVSFDVPGLYVQHIFLSHLDPNESIRPDVAIQIPPNCFNPDCGFEIIVDPPGIGLPSGRVEESDEQNNSANGVCIG